MPTDTTDTTDRLPTNGPDSTTYDRIDSVRTTEGAFMIYDREIGTAWLQSSKSVSLADRR
ncbi:MAG: hypothetical protein ABEI77_02710 [Halorientalis sp.]